MTSGGGAKRPEGEGREGVNRTLGRRRDLENSGAGGAQIHRRGVACSGSEMDRAGLAEGVALGDQGLGRELPGAGA